MTASAQKPQPRGPPEAAAETEFIASPTSGSSWARCPPASSCLVVPLPGVGSPSAEPEVPLGGAGGSFQCLLAVVLQRPSRWGPATSLVRGSTSENWLGGRTWARDRDLFTGAAALGLLPSVLALLSVRLRLYLGWLPIHRAPGKPYCTDHLPRSVGQASWSVAAIVIAPGFWPLSGAPRPLLRSLGGGGGQGLVPFLPHLAWRARPVL